MVSLLRGHRATSTRAVDPLSQDDLALVIRARQDRQAFAALYDTYVDPVYRYCFRRLGSREAAEDATSLVFAKALAALPAYRDDNPSFRSWLFAIAHNVIVTTRMAKRPAVTLNLAELVHDAGISPEDQAIAAIERRDITRLLAQLPQEQRELVELRLQGLSDKEIARVLGRTPGAVRTAQYRAVLRLRQLATERTAKRGAS